MEKIKRKFKDNIYLDLFLCFFKVGVVTIGGGMAMVPLLQEKISAGIACDAELRKTEQPDSRG